MSTAFQGNAFQGNAFQVGAPDLTPPPAVPIVATRIVTAFRRHGWRTIQRVPEIGNFTSHALYANRMASVPFITRTVRGRRLVRLPELLAPATAPVPWIATQRVDAFRRNGWRVLRQVPDSPMYPRTPDATDALVTAALRPDVFRRHGWRHHRELPTYPHSYTAPVSTSTSINEPFVTRRLARGRRLQTITVLPSYPATPEATIPEIAWLRLLQAFNRRSRGRMSPIDVPAIITANPAQPYDAWATRRMVAMKRTHYTHRVAVYPPVYPPTDTGVIEAPSRDIVIRPFLVEHWRKMQ